MPTPSSNHEFYPDKEQNDRADDRHDKTGRMKCCPWLRFGKQTADQSAENRATDPEERRHYETEMLRARHDGPCDQADNETDDYVPDDVQHRFVGFKPPRLSCHSNRCRCLSRKIGKSSENRH